MSETLGLKIKLYMASCLIVSLITAGALIGHLFVSEGPMILAGPGCKAIYSAIYLDEVQKLVEAPNVTNPRQVIEDRIDQMVKEHKGYAPKEGEKFHVVEPLQVMNIRIAPNSPFVVRYVKVQQNELWGKRVWMDIRHMQIGSQVE